MPVSIEELRPHLQAFDFPRLFVEGLGWDYYRAEPSVVHVNERDYTLKPVAEKAGFHILECASDDAPDSDVRRRIELEATKHAHEHIIIFTDVARTQQTWQWVKRELGKPVARRELTSHAGQSGDPILQRLMNLEFTMDQEARGVSLMDVTFRVSATMDVEKVTKRFYDRFQQELKTFQSFVQGITEIGESTDKRDWYASLMLNRMMFVYFVQKQGFLDNSTDYLRSKLVEVQSKYGDGRFQQFYSEFLLKLFHEGLGQPEAQRTPELAALLGRVPFLNGGLFDQHELEKENPGISIPDDAFERVFNFFDGYSWHLDERPGRRDNEINPDVLGYIFEKYVNQKQMGAYYTKEDITGYISRNTVIPFLFDAAKKEHPVAFRPDGDVWRLLRDDPDRYIYPAVRHGMPLDLPGDIAAGVADASKRGGWNAPAPDDYALPTETWREVVARRTRYAEVRAKLAVGEVQDVNDLITLNLDIEQFAKDVIAQSEGPELLRAFWHAMRDVSVLDPTCGSGAFLFAALNILEPLYTACLEGMRGFRDDLERSERPRSPSALSDFKDVLEQVSKHPNERYFILKSIVLNNLYGVDIMEEAVEICKLRLFLKLVAQLERYEDIEPLPDIDFNIRDGNTLVGFTSLDAVREAMTKTPDGQYRAVSDEDRAALARIEERAEEASRAAVQFRWQQTLGGGEITPEHKANLRGRLQGLEDELDRHLATEYGVDLADATAYDAWRASHLPFHWFAEFYGIMTRGGFDVVIGNPPYVSRQRVAESYATRGFKTAACPDIYATVAERSVNVCRTDGRISMIVPLSLTFNSGFASLRSHFYENCDSLWFSSYGRIPSALFSFDTRVRNTIYLARKSAKSPKRSFTTRLHRWFGVQRPALFLTLCYAPFSAQSFEGMVPKLGSLRLLHSFERLLHEKMPLQNELTLHSKYPLYFKKAAYNWLTSCVDLPPAYNEKGQPLADKNYGTLYFKTQENRDLAMLLTNGKILFLWWLAMGDDFNVPQRHFTNAPLGIAQLSTDTKKEILGLLPVLVSTMSDNIDFKLMVGKDIGNYNLARCRHITDESDKMLLEALGLSDLWEEIELEHALVVRTSFEDGEE